MKNRVLRSALAVILVIAMVLTMAACGKEETPAATTTPAPATSTPTPATATPAPTPAVTATPAPTVAPSVDEKDEVADQFGITLEAVDGTYGTEAKVGDKTFKTYMEGLTTPVAPGKVYAYSKLDISKALIMDQDYDIVIKLGDTVVYQGDKGLGTNAASTLTVPVTDFYDGTDEGTVNATFYFVDYDEIYVVYNTAGDYELEFEVLITEDGDDFGAWENEDDAEEFETEIILAASLAKQEKEISIDAFVVKTSDGELKVAAGTRGSAVAYNTATEKDDTTVTFGSLVDLTDETDEGAIADKDYTLKYEIDYTKEAKVGEYAVEVTIVDANGDEVDLDDVNDLLINTVITNIAETTIYVVSAYDWNEIRDVVTSIAEINYTAADAFYGDDSNLSTQVVLAKARYDALSAEQKAFFVGGDVSVFENNQSINYINYANIKNFLGYISDADEVTLATALKEVIDDAYLAGTTKFASVNYTSPTYGWTGTNTHNSANMYAIDVVLATYGDLEVADLVNYTGDATVGYTWTGAKFGFADTASEETSSSLAASMQEDANALAITKSVVAAEYEDFLEAAVEAADEKVVLDAFKEVVKDSEIKDYFATVDVATTAYNIKDTGAITAFNTVDKYFNGLSEDDQDLIKEATIEAYEHAYDLYEAAIAAFDAAEVDSALELTAGAFAAYIKALDNGAKPIYTGSGNNFTTWTYINSTEVKTLTAQAKAAYDALTDAQQDVFDAKDGDNNISNGTVNSSEVDYDGTDKYIDALKQLVSMNTKVDTMIAITEYVNIEDYSTNSVAYNRLHDLIYGTNDGMFFYDDNYAMDDIMSAPSRNFDAIIAEYQAWIDYVIAYEDFKAEIADSFEAAVSEFFAENAEDYAGAVISYATDMENDEAAAIIDAIKAENNLTSIIVNAGFAANYEKTTITIASGTIGTVIAADFTKVGADVEDFETAYEAMTDSIDIDELIDAYCEAFATID